MPKIPVQAKHLWELEDGFIVSAELVLISTVVVLALIVGLSEVRSSISAELSDVAHAFGSVNQSYRSGGKDTGSGRYYDSGGKGGGITFLGPHPEK